MTLQTARKPITPEQAVGIGETLLAENKRLAEENEKLRERQDKDQARIKGLQEQYEALKEFESLIDDPPKQIQITLTDPRIVLKLMGATLSLYGKAGQHPEDIQDNEVLRRRARLNFQTVINACLEYGLGPAWNKVRASYIKPIKL